MGTGAPAGRMEQARADASEAPQRVRVLTVNTHKGFTAFNRRFVLHELREAVRAVSADIVFLQEVLGEAPMPAARHRRDHWPSSQYEFLADSIWPQYAYGKNAVLRGGHHGNAVLSKFPIVSFENRDVSVNGRERRGLLHCVLEIPGRSMHVHAICVHLGLNEAQRRWQLERLCQQIDEKTPAHAPLIVAGDFNDWRSRADAALHPAGLREVHCDAHGVHARSFPARWASPTSWPAQSRSDARSAGADTGWCCRAPASRCRRRRCRSPTG